MAHSSSIRGVIETALYVDDLARSLEFYRGLLGFTVAMEPIDRMVVLNVTDDQVLVLFKKGASTEATVLPFGTIPPTDGDGRLHVAFGSARRISTGGSDGCGMRVSRSRVSSTGPRVGAASTSATRTATPSS